jgi:hypothetical protein
MMILFFQSTFNRMIIFYVDRFRASNLGFHTPLWKMNDDMLRYVAVIHLQSGIFDLSQRRFR